MRIPGTIAAAICLALPAAAGAEEPPSPSKPSTPWVLDYAEERCSLNRTFGEGDDWIGLRLDNFGSWRDYRVLVIGKAVPKSRRPTLEFTYRLTPDAEHRGGSAIGGTANELPAVSFSISFAPHDPSVDPSKMSIEESLTLAAAPKPPHPEFDKLVNSIELQFGNGKTIELALGSMAKPLEAMRTCVENLQTRWGLDAATQKDLSRRAVARPGTVRRVQRSYPTTMVATGTSAYVPVRIMVDAQGRSTACVVQLEGVEGVFKDAVCDGLAKGFEPALDRAGTPVASIYQTSVVYLIGG